MELRVGSLAHFENFLERGNIPYEYAKQFQEFGITNEDVDTLQEERLQKIERAVERLLPNDNTSDDSFPAPNFETSERNLQKAKG